MALGVVTISRAEVGSSPVSTLPFAMSKLVQQLTFGWWTTIYNALCIVPQIIIIRKLTLKTLLQLPLAYVFGRIIDMYVFLYGLLPFVVKELNYPLRLVFCIAGIVISALGVTIIVGADLMLPPPDALMRAYSGHFSKKLSACKIAFDFLWVLLTAVACVIFALARTGGLTWSDIYAINVGTVISVVFSGMTIGFFKKIFPKLDLGLMPDKTLLGKK